MRHALLSIGFAILLTGCLSQDNNNATVKGLDQADADRLNSGRSKFETSDDPPFKSETHFAAGQLAESQNAPAMALVQYQKCLQLQPKNHHAVYRMAVVYTQMKQYPEAIASWKKYMKMTGETSAGYSNLGFCLELSGKLEEAEQYYMEGIHKFPNDQPCRVNYGLLLAREGRVNEAIVELQAVLSEADVHYNIGSVYEQQGKRTEAKMEYQKALAADPKLAEAKSRLATLEKN